MCAMVLLAGVEESCRFDASSGDRVRTLTLPMFARHSPVVKTARNHFGLFAKKVRFCSQNKKKLIRLLLPGGKQIYEFTGCRRKCTPLAEIAPGKAREVLHVRWRN